MFTIHVEGYRLTTRRLNSLARTAKAAVTSGGGIGWDKNVSEHCLKEYFKRAYKDPFTTLFLAVDDATDTVVGSVQLKRPDPIHSASAKHRAAVIRLFVHPEARRNGIGRKLLESLVQTGERFGIKFLCLDVRETQIDAYKLYQKMGFVEFAPHPYYAEVDDVIIKGRLMCKKMSQ